MNKLLKNLINKLTLNPLVSKEDIEKLKVLLKDFYLEKKNYEVLELYKNFSFNHQLKKYDELPYYIWYNLIKYKGDKLYIYIDGEILNPPASECDKMHLERLVKNYKEKNLKKKDI